MTNEGTKFFDLTITKVTTVLSRRDTRPRHYIRDRDHDQDQGSNPQGQDQDSENTVSRRVSLSRDFPSL